MIHKNENNIKTFANQDTLPNLPVPSIKETLNKYLASVKPLVSMDEYEKTKEMVINFLNHSESKQLQNYLIERSKTYRNWLENWWDVAAYLSFRESIAININMFVGFGTLSEFSISVPQCRRAAELIRYNCEFHELLLQEKVIPEYMQKRPLCMNMYKRIFSECRIPGKNIDTLQVYDSSEIDYITVISRGVLFLLKVYEHININKIKDRPNVLSIGDLEKQLQYIDKYSEYIISLEKISNKLEKKDKTIYSGIGSFTSIHRDQWFDIYCLLNEMDKINKFNLINIQKSLFVICLEDSSPRSPSDLLYTSATGDCKNRWYDKSLQYIIFKNGLVAANMEHANADATIFKTMFNWLGDRYQRRSGGYETIIESSSKNFLPPPIALEWKLNEQISKKYNIHIEMSIKQANENFNNRGSDFTPISTRFKSFGKSKLKLLHCSGDTFVQMCLQYTYYIIYKRFAPTYESAHTRAFYHGRTETIRTCSIECTEWIKLMFRTTQSKSGHFFIPNDKEICLNILNTFKNACEKHKCQVIEALNGQGIDRHLLGLQLARMEIDQTNNNSPLFNLIQDPSFTKSGGKGNFILSTSNVSGYSLLWGGFAPMVPNGYGICYAIEKDSITFVITSFRSTNKNHVTSNEFGEILFNCLNNIYTFLVHAEGLQQKSKI